MSAKVGSACSAASDDKGWAKCLAIESRNVEQYQVQYPTSGQMASMHTRQSVSFSATAAFARN